MACLVARSPRSTTADDPVGGRRRLPRLSAGLCLSAGAHLGVVGAVLLVEPRDEMAFGSPASIAIQMEVAMAPPPSAAPPEALPIPDLQPEAEQQPEPVVATPSPEPPPQEPVAEALPSERPKPEQALVVTPVEDPLPSESEAPVMLPTAASSTKSVVEKPPTQPVAEKKPESPPKPALPPRNRAAKAQRKPAPKPDPAPAPPAATEAAPAPPMPTREQTAAAPPAGAAPAPSDAPAIDRVAAPVPDHGPIVVHDPAYSEPPTPPSYPPRAVLLGQQGRVIVRAAVNAQGEPDSVAVWESSGFALLDSAAVTAVKRWRFVPARRGGAPVAALVQVPVNFRLK